jgi:hypothetical protein
VRRASAAIATLALVGCGQERLPVPDVDRPAASAQATPREFAQAGVRFDAPADWSFGRGTAPLVTSTSSGSATIAIWRYPRTEPLPTGKALDGAEQALLDAVKQRDRTYEEVSTEQTRVDGEPAIELIGEQRVAGRTRRVRSTHVFAHGAELVIDQYAAPRDFPAVDRTVFVPLVDSLRLDDPKG